MSFFDVSSTAGQWLAALAARARAEEKFRSGTEDMQNSYRTWLDAIAAEEAARLAHLSALVDLPQMDVADDARIARLRAENLRLVERQKKLRRELTEARVRNEERNRALDALHYVWCSGGCEGGVHRYGGTPDDVTEEVVAEAERNTQRLRQWYVNRQAKVARARARAREESEGGAGE